MDHPVVVGLDHLLAVIGNEEEVVVRASAECQICEKDGEHRRALVTSIADRTGPAVRQMLPLAVPFSVRWYCYSKS